MQMRHSLPRVLAVLWLGVGLVVVGVARADELPRVQHGGLADYLSGGIGSGEIQAIRAAAPHWPLCLEFAARDAGGAAAFVADVDVSIHDAAHQLVLSARSDGPLMLVRLAPGQYTVDATQAGLTQSRQITVVADHPLRLAIIWR